MKKVFIITSLLFTAIIVNAQTYQQLAKLIAADRATGNQLGNAVAISGNYAIVAAADISYGQIQNSCQCVYVFENTNGNWIQKQKLVASDRALGIDFGHAVSISGNSIIVGAPGDENNAGAAYIFERNSTGNWLQVKKIVAPTRTAGDLFGTSVSIIANYALVGAPGDDGLASGWPKLPGAGAAYFFTNLNGTWEVLNKAFPVVGAYYDRSQGAAFGFSVSISGSTTKGISAVIGAPFEKKDTTGANPLDGAGAAYVFQRNLNGGMELVHKVVYWRRAAGDQFGYSVSMSGNQMVIGAPFTKEDARQENPIISAGAAHVFFKQVDGTWWWDRVLVPNDRAIGDNFGSSVCISGDMIIAGAPAKKVIIGNVNYVQAGAAYLFKFSNDSLSAGWRPVNRIIADDHTDQDWFGYGVGIDGKNVIVGAPFQDKDVIGTALAEAGAIYVFGQTTCASTNSSISPSACRSYTSPSKKYTWSATGTYTDIIPNKAGCDSIITINLTITHKVDTSVTQNGNTLTANIKDASYQWIDCNTNEPININTRSLIASVNGSYKVRIEHDGCSGVSSCHTVNPNKPIDKKPLDEPINTTPVSYSQLKEFVEINKLIPKDREGYENFGYSVGISGEYAVIGANVDDKDAKGDNPISDAGSAYIFKKQKDGKWKEVQKIVASDRANGDNFGWSVAINNNHIVVGAIYHDKDLQGNDHSPSSGAAYIFVLGDDGVWVQKQKLVANPIEGQILFGHSVAIDGNTIAVGCPWYAKDATGKPETNLNGAGAVFVFDKTGGTWVQSQILTPSIRNINNLGDDLGWSVAICGDLIIAGAWGVDFDEKGEGTRMEASGAAYIFERSGGKWKEVQKIVASDRAAHDQFGYSVAISGDNAIIGAWNKTETADPDSRPFTGNAYIFSRKAAPNRVLNDGRVILLPESDGKWRQVLKINPEDRRPDDYLGWSVSMSGDYAIVSAMKQDTDSLDNLINDGGAIYVFYQDKNGKWSQTGKLATFDRSQLDNFGHAVAISGCDIIGGTIVDQEDDKDANALTSAGSAYIFSASDCRNVAPCYRPKVTPDIKTPRDKTGTNKSTSSLDAKSTTPQKIQSVDQNSKSNENVIQTVELGNEGLTQPVNINSPKPKTESLNNSNDFNPKSIQLCIDKINTTPLPPRPPDEIYRFVPKISADGSVEEIPGVLKQELSVLTDKMWIPGQVITVGFYPDQASDFVINKVKQFAVVWENIANIRFRFVESTSGAMIKVGFDANDGSWSWIGRDVLLNPMNKKTMNFGWFTDDTDDEEFSRTVCHEFGHAIGFIHEHQAPTGGIQWDKEKVYSYFGAEPISWSRKTVDEQIFARYAITGTNSTIYDSRSIMHYYFPPELTKNGFEFTRNTVLSKPDSDFVKLVYPLPFEPGDAKGMLLTGDDCDEIVFLVDYKATGVASNEVDFVLEPGIDHHGNWITWWKKIGIPLKGGGEAAMEIENKSISNRKFALSVLDNTRPMTFWKAKLFGVHTLLDKKWYVMPALVGGCRVRLTWRRDTCL